MIIGAFTDRVSASYTPALVVSWAMFLLLALTAMRFKPALVVYLGGLLIAGLATAIASTHTRRHSPRRTPSAQRWKRYLTPDTMP
jgi:hypothetical protein